MRACGPALRRGGATLRAIEGERADQGLSASLGCAVLGLCGALRRLFRFELGSPDLKDVRRRGRVRGAGSRRKEVRRSFVGGVFDGGRERAWSFAADACCWSVARAAEAAASSSATRWDWREAS